MEEWIKVIAPVIAPLVGIAALWWKLATSMATKKDISELRADMYRADDKLHADMGNLEDRLFTEMSKLNDRMDKLDDRMDKLSDRMDGLYDAHHADIMKVLDKMDGVANDLRAEIRERIHGKADSVEDR
jgi:predicted nuclease with TOPRIM domain